MSKENCNKCGGWHGGSFGVCQRQYKSSSEPTCYVSAGWVTRLNGKPLNIHPSKSLADAECHALTGSLVDVDFVEVFIRET